MSLIRVPLSPSLPSRRGLLQDDAFLGSCSALGGERRHLWQHKGRSAMVVVAKGKRAMGGLYRQYQRPPPPPLPTLEDDGNPKFVIFARTSNVSLWYPLTVITGGTSAKIMVSAKDTFLGKYLYSDTIARNLAAVIYKDEKEVRKIAYRQMSIPRTNSPTSFRYGYKLVENNKLRSALSPSGVIELPAKEELKTVVDKVKDFFGDATNNVKESFGKLTFLNASSEDSDSKPKAKS